MSMVVDNEEEYDDDTSCTVGGAVVTEVGVTFEVTAVVVVFVVVFVVVVVVVDGRTACNMALFSFG